jgi:acetyltransferase-like isoleucine patch superfamily enzyme
MESESVLIGDNVWLGRNVMLLKGTKLENNIIVAAGSVVSKEFTQNAIIGGVPAKVIKSIYE